MIDDLNEKLPFTIEEASKFGLGSVRRIRYRIKQRDIQCIPPWVEGGKRQKHFIPRSELVRLGLLPPPAEIDVKLNAAQVLKLKDLEKHLVEIYEVKKLLASELWLPLLHYLPACDLSTQHNKYWKRTIYWTDSEDSLPVIKLPSEHQDRFVRFKQHTESSKLWTHLPEWKRLGGLYIRNQSILLNNIKGNVQIETKLPIISKDTERGVFKGFSWVIFRNLFPQTRPDKKKSKKLTEKAISLASYGHWNEAVEINIKIIKMFPSDTNALKRLGKALMELQRYVSAKEAYSQALEIDPYDPVARRMLDGLIQKCPDYSDISGVDGGRYRVVSKRPDLWLLAVFNDDAGENIASVYPTEIDIIITTFQGLLNKYRVSHEVKTILELRSEIDQLEQSLFPELNRITLKTIAESKCDRCPI